jgi:hypothetical protein
VLHGSYLVSATHVLVGCLVQVLLQVMEGVLGHVGDSQVGVLHNEARLLHTTRMRMLHTTRMRMLHTTRMRMLHTTRMRNKLLAATTR